MATRTQDSIRDSYAKENQKVEAATDHLPELTGTEKQIAWAKDLRHQSLVGVNKLIKQLNRGSSRVKHITDKPDLLKRALRVLDQVMEVKEAKFWIENGGGRRGVGTIGWLDVEVLMPFGNISRFK